MTFREYASSTRTTEHIVLPDNPEEDIFSLRHVRALVAATVDYDSESAIRVYHPTECEDDPLGSFWINGMAVQETTPGESRGYLDPEAQ